MNFADSFPKDKSEHVYTNLETYRFATLQNFALPGWFPMHGDCRSLVIRLPCGFAHMPRLFDGRK